MLAEMLFGCVVLGSEGSATYERLVSTSDGDGADTTVSPSFNIDAGGFGVLEVKHSPVCNPMADDPGTDPNRKVYLRFDLAGVPISLVESAALELNYSEPRNANAAVLMTDPILQLFDLHDGVPGDARPPGGWAENTMAWTDAPGNDVASYSDFLPGMTSEVGSMELPAVQPVDGPVKLATPALLDGVRGDTNGMLTLMLSLRFSSQNCQSQVITFESRESADPEPSPPVLRLTVRGCGPADLAEPFGTVNFFDISAYIGSYVQQQPGADLTAPLGAWNIFDVFAYIDLFNAGCP
ncbi:MAG: GC-type dockerin domain-anchored protein [Planctomycetota bacterium]